MATEVNFSITKGRTGRIIANITGISNWSGLSAKFVASRNYELTPDLVITGSIDAQNNQVIFDYNYNHTANLNYASYMYEIIIYKADKSYLKTAIYGVISIKDVVVKDPTT